MSYQSLYCRQYAIRKRERKYRTAFWPEAETKSQIAAETLNALRKSKSVTWLLLHHRRKTSAERVVGDLVTNPQGWFQEAAGSLALVNQSDTRIGVEPYSKGEADLLVAGIVRGSGAIPPLELARTADDEGNPVGYRLLVGRDRLTEEDRAVYDSLPDRCRFRDVEKAMCGKSASNATRLINRCESLKIMRKDGKGYVKCVPAVEPVEQVERSSGAPSTP